MELLRCMIMTSTVKMGKEEQRMAEDRRRTKRKDLPSLAGNDAGCVGAGVGERLRLRVETRWMRSTPGETKAEKGRGGRVM
jgi:hypothetical protein